jgi:hypothetical protein
VCRSKHVEPSINFGIINSITKLHFVGISTEGYEYNHALFLRWESFGHYALPTGRQSTSVRTVLLTCLTLTGNKKTIKQKLFLIVNNFVNCKNVLSVRDLNFLSTTIPNSNNFTHLLEEAV